MAGNALPFEDDEFIAAVFHDLRGPLAGIEMHAASLMRTPATAEGLDRIHRRADAIQRSAARARLLLQDLHELLKSQHGRLELALVGHPAAALLDECAAGLQAQADERGSRFAIEVLDPGLAVRCDPARLQRALWHLATNAILHGREHGQITLRVARAGDDARFEISDQGPGVPEGRRDTLFRPLRSKDRPSGVGLGLGLCVARGLVSAHGGQLWLERSGPDGTTFAFTVPHRGLP